MTHRWSGWPGAWCLDCGIEDPAEACVANNPQCVCALGEPTSLPCIAPRTPCAHPDEGRADPYRRATWAAWYDKEGDAAEEAGMSALGWVDERSPDAFREIDGMLLQVEVDRLPTPVLIDILNATWCLRDQLQFRGPFVAKVIPIFGARLGDERAAALMKNRGNE